MLNHSPPLPRIGWPLFGYFVFLFLENRKKTVSVYHRKASSSCWWCGQYLVGILLLLLLLSITDGDAGQNSTLVAKSWICTQHVVPSKWHNKNSPFPEELGFQHRRFQTLFPSLSALILRNWTAGTSSLLLAKVYVSLRNRLSRVECDTSVGTPSTLDFHGLSKAIWSGQLTPRVFWDDCRSEVLLGILATRHTVTKWKSCYYLTNGLRRKIEA